MKKALKKITAFSLVLMLAIGLCACSSNKETTSNDSKVTTEVTPETTKEAESTPAVTEETKPA